MLLRAGAIKVEVALCPKLDFACWPVSVAARCVLGEVWAGFLAKAAPLQQQLCSLKLCHTTGGFGAREPHTQ